MTFLRTSVIVYAIAIGAAAHATPPGPPLPTEPKAPAGAAAKVAVPAYIARGDEVEKKYDEYTEKLARAYEVLKAALVKDAPDLYRKLKPEPPKPVAYGYQIVPELTKDAAFGERTDPPRASSSPYSWERTSIYIDWQLPKLDEMLEQLKAARSVTPKERREVYERYIKEYKEFEENQRLVDTHIKYNRFWQHAIAEDRPRFDRLTKLHDLVLARQAIQDALGAKAEADFRALVSRIPPIEGLKLDLAGPRAELERSLSSLERQMAEAIHSQNANITVPAYLKLSHPRKTLWQVEVPLYTDITDRKFLNSAKAAIERLWSIDDRERSYKMKVTIRQLAPVALYKGAAPKRGAHIDLKSHTERFPRDGGVLTTGTNSTYAIPGKYIALGPQPISQNVLAHEFGHILGFVDGYFRGYHDLGAQGFEVLEVVPDPDDIMSTPGAGRVLPYHYDKLFARKFDRPAKAR